MHKINIKPISTNEAWKGRRFKSDLYKKYERDLLFLLPKCTLPEGQLRLTICFNLSNSNNDIDNSLKPFIDVLQKKYGFNDNKIYELIVKKQIVKKGLESVLFSIESMII